MIYSGCSRLLSVGKAVLQTMLGILAHGCCYDRPLSSFILSGDE